MLYFHPNILGPLALLSFPNPPPPVHTRSPPRQPGQQRTHPPPHLRQSSIIVPFFPTAIFLIAAICPTTAIYLLHSAYHPPFTPMQTLYTTTPRQHRPQHPIAPPETPYRGSDSFFRPQPPSRSHRLLSTHCNVPQRSLMLRRGVFIEIVYSI